MAYFEYFITRDGVNNASFAGTDAQVSSEWSMDSETSLEVMIWNEGDVPVDVHLETGDRDIVIVVPNHYDQEHVEVNWRSFAINNNPQPVAVGIGCTLDIRGLAPNSVFPCRFAYENLSDKGSFPWLDASDCNMQVRGHGSNVNNGDRVWVMGHTPRPLG